LQKSLKELKAAQNQLVQQEKLASLGQLTAGIAHEIKNPLNFVNNFSELSMELVDEIREEVTQQTSNVKRETGESPFEGGKYGGAGQGDDSDSGVDSNRSLILEILDDIEANLRKIHEHGSRADSIVKSMLQHSRGGSGEPEPTDLNALIREYVNLTFHGMRAGKNPINIDIDLQLDENIDEVPLVAEDFSRVILNLCNNAFDAMAEKLALDGEPDYLPKLTVRTIKQDSKITLEVEDNGPGVPEVMIDKILQPFFTTKKGTQGTGLGLSITHDIIKAHGGELKIESKVGQFTRFIILLPST
ncbi:MAG: ATP-binding protein, partial [Balneolaceae bacterium]|nr:ATP-binding protein [Balneolaceae bacterium]